MRLFIAEKPSVAKAIAAELGITGRNDGWIECGSDKITWCFGHMLEQAGPDEYTSDEVPTNGKGRKIWRTDELPIIPDNWISRPKEEARKQVKIIASLVKSATQVVNAGDPDREGNLLVDSLLDYIGNRAPVVRYWSNAIDSVSVNRALASMRDNKEYEGYSKAAEGRGKADWLIGMNLSRAYTLRGKRGGASSLITVGRVQTPTLSLVVSRDLEIESFQPTPYHTIRATFSAFEDEDMFCANWSAGEEQAGLDAEGRLVDAKVARDLVELVSGKAGVVVECVREKKKKNHPLTFSLSAITAVASSRFGYTAEDVLKLCQSLYETHKLTSYPRTDCAYLPESQFSDAPKVLAAVASMRPDLKGLIDDADMTIRSRTWNDSKVSAHHGIIPTMHRGDMSKLDEKEQNIYELIVRSYLAQFYPVHEYQHTTLEVDVCGEKFKASGKVVTKAGWTGVFSDSQGESSKGESQTLPLLVAGDAIVCTDAEQRDVKTKPPSRFTEGTLITAMVNVHRFVTDPEHKKLLRDDDGIGTEATRASIISELKRRNYIEPKGKSVVSTALGRSICKALPAVLKSPVLTALYERMLKGVERGDADLSAFMEKQEKFIREQVAKANDGVAIISEKDKTRKTATRSGKRLKKNTGKSTRRATANG